MFHTKSKKRSIDDEVEHILSQMSLMDVGSTEYQNAAHTLEVMCKAKNARNERRVSPDTIVIALTSVAEIILMLNFEKFNVVSTKTLGLLLKGRV